MKPFAPRLEILPPAQRKLWNELSETPDETQSSETAVTSVETESCCHQHVSACNRLKELSIPVPHLFLGKSEHVGKSVGGRR